MRRLFKPLAIGAGCAILACGAPFCPDYVLRQAIIRTGQRVTGAVVDVGSARIRLLSGRLELRSVAVADKRRPWRNLFQFNRAVLDFSPRALLRGRLLVREAGIDGLVTGTARSSIGALRGGGPTPFEMMIEAQLAPASVAAPREQAALDALASRLSALERAAPGEALPGLAAQVQRVRESAAALRSHGLMSPASLAKRARDLAALDRQVRDARSRIEDAERALADQFEEVRRKLAQAGDSRAQDVDARLASEGVPEPDANGLDRRLLGAAAADAVATGLSWARLARGKSRPPRAFGRPAMIIETTRLSGKIEGAAAGQDMELEGMILGASSNPRLYGKPTRLFFKGEAPDGASVLGLQGTLEQGKPPGSAELAFHYSGIALKGAALGDDAFGAVIESGLGRVNGALRIEDRRWSGRFSFAAEEVVLSPRVRWSGPAASRAAALLKAVSVFKVDVSVEGEDDDLRVTLTSTLGPALAAALSSSPPPRWLAARRAAERAVEAAYGSRLESLRGKAARLRASLSRPLEKDRAALAAAARRTEEQAIQASFPPAP